MHQMPRLFGWIYKNDLQRLMAVEHSICIKRLPFLLKEMYMSLHFSRLKNLWEEFEALVPAPTCNCAKSKEYVLHLQQLKLFQFLMGLNESYIQARYLDD